MFPGIWRAMVRVVPQAVLQFPVQTIGSEFISDKHQLRVVRGESPPLRPSWIRRSSTRADFSETLQARALTISVWWLRWR